MSSTQHMPDLHQVERAKGENLRSLRRLQLKLARGHWSTATLNAIERRQSRDLDYQRQLAALEEVQV